MDLSKRKLLFPGIVIFWLLIAVLNLSQTFLSSYARGWDFIWAEQLVYASGWLLWIGYTPLIFYLTKRHPVQSQINWPFLKRNILIALGFALIHCALDITLQYGLWNFIVGPKHISGFFGSFYYKYHVNLFIFLFVAGASYTVDYLKRSKRLELEKSRLEGLLAEAKLMSVKNQIQPHFLFNTHHSIIGLMMNEKSEEAIKMLTRLSDLLRRTLELGDQQFIPLKEELAIMDLFLDIHEVRFSDRLTVKKEIDEELMECLIPSMLLQPLVENALKHGISKSSTAGSLFISVTGNENIHVRIQDDGPGVNGSIKTGIGLMTTQNRLRHLYGERFTLETFNTKPNGFAIELSFPRSND